MAYRLERKNTELTPYVLIDEENRYLKIEGESFHENVIEFFKEINTWLGSFLKTDFASFTFDCELKYFNSSTTMVLFNMLSDMDNSRSSKNITVNWIVAKDNKIIIESGEDFQEELENLKFNFIIK